MTDVSEGCIEETDRVLADYPRIMNRIVRLQPDVISANFPYDSDFPVVAVCLRDAQTAFGQAVHALHQFCIEGAKHRSENAEAGPVMAACVERFYVEDAAMRIYSAAEHLANAVAMLRGLDDEALKASRVASQWERVRKVLGRGSPRDIIVRAMNELRSDPGWRFTMRYRGQVVHNQPTLLRGLGIVYERRRRWEQTANGGYTLRVGRGDVPRHDAQDVRASVLEACHGFLSVLEIVLNEYVEGFRGHGIAEGATGLLLRPFARGP